MARKVLGQGLRALIPEDSQLSEALGTGEALSLIPLERIAPNPAQPRRRFDDESIAELSTSIREQGILQPIVVRRSGAHFEVIVGERRVRAARRAGLETIPAVIRDGIEDTDLLALALVENIQREDLDPIEEAQAFKELMTRGPMTQQQVAARVGKSREAVANALRLLNLPTDIQQLVADGALSPGHARAILSVARARQRRLAEMAVSRSLTVRQLERISRAAESPRARPARDPDVEALELELEELLSARVRLSYRGTKGRIEVSFQSLEELDRLLAVLRRGSER